MDCPLSLGPADSDAALRQSGTDRTRVRIVREEGLLESRAEGGGLMSWCPTGGGHSLHALKQGFSNLNVHRNDLESC